jgi:hypothetical protein
MCNFPNSRTINDHDQWYQDVLIVLRSILAHKSLHISIHLAGLQHFNESGYAMMEEMLLLKSGNIGPEKRKKEA